MTLRSARERVLQTFCYEATGLCLAVPAYMLFSGGTAPDSLVLIAALSVAVMAWSPVHNTIFDWLEFRLTGRIASDRPSRLRLLHAVSHEANALVVTLPILIVLGNHGFAEALVVDIGLTVIYTAHAYVFHLIYDRFRPVRVSSY